jgi:hypothetical protein
MILRGSPSLRTSCTMVSYEGELPIHIKLKQFTLSTSFNFICNSTFFKDYYIHRSMDKDGYISLGDHHFSPTQSSKDVLSNIQMTSNILKDIRETCKCMKQCSTLLLLVNKCKFLNFLKHVCHWYSIVYMFPHKLQDQLIIKEEKN